VFIVNCCELPQIATYVGFVDPIFAYNNVPKKKFPNAIGISSFTPSYITLKCIYIRNSLSLDLSPKYLLINNNLIFTALILLTLSFSAALFIIN